MTTGEIYYEEEKIDIKSKNICEIRKDIGMVFQQFNLFPHLTVKQNIMLAPKLFKQDSIDKLEEETIKLLSKIDLIDKLNEYPNNLSGGQKQRIAIIRALMMKPSILLFDEATSALDPEMTKEVLNLITDLSNTGITMIIVTHEMEFAKRVGTEIVFMDNGQIVEQGIPTEIFNNPQTDRLKKFLKNF